ncbi:hypothetical protein [Pilimelia terevasa]|uniref:hypothetical protein n=1 Tax=Pilimelia terevasa TaxID=53372 RepID=UPI00166ED729|nr:hypothetical protein [Pilimelia terevasa]
MFDLDAELAEPCSGGGVVEGAGFEGGQVLVDGGVLGADLGGEGVEFLSLVGGVLVVLVVGALECGGQEGVGLGVEVSEGVEDELVEDVGG